jgi:hypothetical protein
MMPNEPDLDRLLERYAHACPEVEPGAGFMPGIWQRIDARQGFAFKLATYARVLAMTAASLCLAAGLFELSSYGPSTQLASNRYVDVLDDDNDTEVLTYADVVSTDHPGDPSGGAQ